MARSVKLGTEEYEEIPKEAVAASKVLVDLWIKLGRPQTPLSDSGEKIVNLMIAIWEDCYPLQAKMWYADRKEYRNNEMTTSEQVHKKTGRSLASYPLPIYSMMKKVFKGFDPAERKNCMKMVHKWPMFQMANKV